MSDTDGFRPELPSQGDVSRTIGRENQARSTPRLPALSPESAIAPVNAPSRDRRARFPRARAVMAAQFTWTKARSRRGARVVDRAGNQFFAGARLAQDQYRRICKRHDPDQGGLTLPGMLCRLRRMLSPLASSQ